MSQVTQMVITNSTVTLNGALSNFVGIKRWDIDGSSGPDLIDASAWTGDGVDLNGLGGDDVIKGLRSIDSLNGGAGNDDIYAGPRDERARDTVVGGPGKDFVQVFNRPAAKDVVNCGKDRDRVVADSEGVLSGCERKRRR